MNIKYLAYNLLRTDYKELNKCVSQLARLNGGGKMLIYRDMMKSFVRHDTRFLDYFYFRHFEDDVDRSYNSNVWDMHLFHRKYNSKKHAQIFKDKILFRDKFSKFFNYPYFVLKRTADIILLKKWIQEGGYSRIVAKEPLGTVGKGVKVLDIKYENDKVLINDGDFNTQINKLHKAGFTLYESFIEQNDVLAKIYPGAINTIRVVTFINNKNELEFWGTILRMGYDKQVDNFDAGGISAKIDSDTGVIVSSAKIKNPFIGSDFEFHPITKQQILNVQIPYWTEVIEMVKEVAFVVPEVRTVGWDVAITKSGPTLIEGNDNWDKTHFEIVSGIGLGERIKKLIK